jgi:hypothetical protein
MTKNSQKRNQAQIVNMTKIRKVEGQQHSGSGPINVGTSDAHTANSAKEAFLAALREFQAELESGGYAPDEARDNAVIEVRSAQLEASKEEPNADQIRKKLENTKAIIVSGAGIATATTALASESGKLVRMIESLIQTIGKLFL